MSTTFGIYRSDLDIKLDDDYCLPSGFSDDDFIEVAFRGNSTGFRWLNELAPKLPKETKIYPLDNSAQGVFTIGDVISEMEEDK